MAAPRSSADLLDACNATLPERRLVVKCVRALKVYEDDMARRLTEDAHHGYRAGGDRERKFASAEDVLNNAGVPWKRQVPLLSAAVALAHESGLALAYNTLSPLRRKLVGERSA